MTDWPEMTKELSPHLRDLRQTMPEVMKAFAAISQDALAPKALDTKTKELMRLPLPSLCGATTALLSTSSPLCKTGGVARRGH